MSLWNAVIQLSVIIIHGAYITSSCIGTIVTLRQNFRKYLSLLLLLLLLLIFENQS